MNMQLSEAAAEAIGAIVARQNRLLFTILVNLCSHSFSLKISGEQILMITDRINRLV